MTSDHLGELSPERLQLWQLILPEERVSCDFPLLGQSDIFYERQFLISQPNHPHYVPRAEDGILVQVRHPVQQGKFGAIFILNTESRTLQRSYLLADLGIKDPVYLYHWENQSANEQPVANIAVTLSAHQSALYFFSRFPIQEPLVRLPSS